MSRTSSTSIKSQASPMRDQIRPDDAEDDSSPISQLQFATQAPMVDINQALRRPLGELEQNIDRLPQSKLMLENGGQARNAGNSQTVATQDSTPKRLPTVDISRANSPELNNKQNPGHRHVTRPAGAVDSQEFGGHNQLQRTRDGPGEPEIKVSPQGVGISSRSTSLKEEGRSSDDRATQRVHTIDVTDDGADMHVWFRRWRAEAAVGRHIPRRACKIPKQQLKILESDESWQPPLPGRDPRPGTVPIGLLNELTIIADEPAHQRQCVDPSPRVDHEKAFGPRESVVEESANKYDDLASSQELPVSQWSASPGRLSPTDLLPLDSSLPSAQDPTEADMINDDSQMRYEQSHINVCSYDHGHDARPDQVRDLLSDPNGGRGDKPQAGPADSSGRSFSEQHHNNEAFNKPSASSQPSHLPTQQVQVHRTPFPGKTTKTTVHDIECAALRSGDPPGYADPPSFVPCTFNEAWSYTLSASRGEFDIQRQPNVVGNAVRSTETSEQPVKRKAVDEVPMSSTKRTKLQPTVSSVGKQEDHDLAWVMEQKRQYRRQVLQSLSKKATNAQPTTQPQSGRSVSSIRTRTSSDLPVTSKAIPSSDRARPVSTPRTCLSIIEDTRSSMSNSLRTGSAKESVTGPVDMSKLFGQFSAVYKDYGGHEEHFSQALSLLRKLRLMHTEPHPSLFDDFVYHHFHTYRRYFFSCFDSDESPLPYGVYYKERIESPSHHARVIRASVIDWPFRSQAGSRDVLEKPALDSAAPRQDEVVERTGSVQNGRDHAHAPPAQVKADLDEQNLDRPCDTEQAASHVNPSQKSSVETWLEGTARAGSPELGTLESARYTKPISAPNLRPPSTTRVTETSSTIKREDVSPPIRKDKTKQKKRLSVSPFAQSLGTNAKGFKKHSKEMTAFQRWAKAIMNLPGETPVTNSVKKPTNHVNIFGWRE